MPKTFDADSLRAGAAAEGFSGPAKWLLAAEIVAVYARVQWIWRRHALSWVVETLRRRRTSRRSNFDQVDLVDVDPWPYGFAVVRVLRFLPGDSRCLVRSLVLLTILARRGIDTALVIGVRTEPEFAAHAWIEFQGEPLLTPGEQGDGRLVEL